MGRRIYFWVSANGKILVPGPGSWGTSHDLKLFLNDKKLYAPVAQLDRVSGYGPEGWGFESSRAYMQKALLVGAFIIYKTCLF